MAARKAGVRRSFVRQVAARLRPGTVLLAPGHPILPGGHGGSRAVLDPGPPTSRH